MEMENKNLRTVINTLVSISMELLMVMANIFGLMVVLIKEISNMELDMAMASGMIIIKLKYFRGAIEWTRNKVMEYMNGLVNRHIKGNLKMTTDKVMEDCIR